MKTAEITRAKTASTGVKPPSTWAVFADIYRREGLAGVNKGVNAVAVRQCTNWGSRYVYELSKFRCNLTCPISMGFARLAEDMIKKVRGKGESDKLGPVDKIVASSIGGALATWNQPIEVIRVEVRGHCDVVLSKNYEVAQILFRCKAWPKALHRPTAQRSSPF